MTCSPYKITFFGVVLLDFDDEVDSLPTFPVRGEVQSITYAGAAEATIFGRQGRIESLNWSRLRNWASHPEAQGMAIAGRLRIPVGKVGVLKVEVKDGASFEYREFALEEPIHGPAIGTAFEVRESYSGIGTGLVITDRAGLGGELMGEEDGLMGATADNVAMAERGF